FLMAFAVCLVAGMLWAAYPLEYYIAERRVEDWMIYRFLVCGLLASAGYQLLAGTALAHRMARFGPPRQAAESFWPVLVARLFEGWPLVAFITFCTAASLAVLWPGLAEYAATGHVQMHWSRLVTGTFGLVVASQGVVAGILMRVLDIWQIQAVHKSSRAQRHATGGSRGKP
ncbi:MAG: hypothetical protein PHO07_19780, partial [Pirellulales bacterium]|nr:hypothetical protein [Pirellulales bacterium]